MKKKSNVAKMGGDDVSVVQQENSKDQTYTIGVTGENSPSLVENSSLGFPWPPHSQLPLGSTEERGHEHTHTFLSWLLSRSR